MSPTANSHTVSPHCEPPLPTTPPRVAARGGGCRGAAAAGSGASANVTLGGSGAGSGAPQCDLAVGLAVEAHSGKRW